MMTGFSNVSALFVHMQGIMGGQSWCCAAKDWDKGQFPFAIFNLYNPLGFQVAGSRSYSSTSDWVPAPDISAPPGWCDSEKLLPHNLAYTKYKQHPCTYAKGGPPMSDWNGKLQEILKNMQVSLGREKGGLILAA
jgi:hypothetical protein